MNRYIKIPFCCTKLKCTGSNETWLGIAGKRRCTDSKMAARSGMKNAWLKRPNAYIKSDINHFF